MERTHSSVVYVCRYCRAPVIGGVSSVLRHEEICPWRGNNTAEFARYFEGATSSFLQATRKAFSEFQRYAPETRGSIFICSTCVAIYRMGRGIPLLCVRKGCVGIVIPADKFFREMNIRM